MDEEWLLGCRNLRVSVVWGSGFLMAVGATIRCITIGKQDFRQEKIVVKRRDQVSITQCTAPDNFFLLLYYSQNVKKPFLLVNFPRIKLHVTVFFSLNNEHIVVYLVFDYLA